ncbi:MAG: hypothetical protein EWV41_10660 [Microcystis wesenbergii Mw_MB_S_20031200_S109]|uniref:Uncharacterized protein n=1 Tax=Microcystis wesenbergii Mw_MB_S_20031200_S109D TaxID=2486241 RepID=A0A552LDP4_9CHRO|nr:MAG: hypothetical protein EWV41_10660 [Microcystis wesenbergii Mw_MB_S_20031200_S109]TRV18328.1 MAG: hypothetical protein EWV88_20930 [Microcystis wesenbergii Mw_MB_S_20031200_S109D]
MNKLLTLFLAQFLPKGAFILSWHNCTTSIDLNWNNLDKYTIKAFCQENNIKLIIDAPHAQIIWQLGINYATLTNIPYLHPIKKSVLS